MNPNMYQKNVSWWTLALLLGLVTSAGLAVSGDNSGGAAHIQSTLEFFSVPETKWPGFADMVIDTGGIPWIMANNKVFYWAGDGFREPVTGEMWSGQYLTGLYGGSDRGAYASQRGEGEHEGLLYRLDDGAATLVTTFYYEVTHEYPGLYVSKSGTLFNWGHRFLARYNGESWDRIEARLSLRPLIFDLDDAVYFYYDNSLYCAGPSGELEARTCPKWIEGRPGETRIVGALWAATRALLVNYAQPDVFAFDLRTGEPVDLTETMAGFESTPFFDAFSLRNGDVWILGSSRQAHGSAFFRLSADGELSEIPGTAGLDWENTRCWQFPESVLETSDGTIIFGLPHGGIAIYRDGELSQWGWEYGFTGSNSPLHEDPDGSVWMPVDRKVARLRLAEDPPPTVPAVADWEEIALAGRSRVWELTPGVLAMFREDIPGKLSRWDGEAWTHQEVPFETTRIGLTARDDRGHLLVTMTAFPDGFFDIGPSSVRRFDNMESMIENAVADGAREFKTDELPGIMVTPEHHIWLGYDGSDSVRYFDGTRWDELGFRSRLMAIFRSHDHGFLFGDGERFFGYDRGQMVEVHPRLSNARKLLIGEKYLQPYERPLIDEYPGRYFPVLKEPEGMTLFFDADDFEAAARGEEIDWESASLRLPPYTDRMVAVPSGGAWVFDPGPEGPYLRLFGRRLLRIDLSGTPVKGDYMHGVLEDKGGGLWFVRQLGGSMGAYHYRQSQITLSLEEPPQECGRTLELGVTVAPERMAGGIHFFTHVNQGEWESVPDEEKTCLFRFPVTGEYECQVTGLQRIGRLKSSPAVRVRALVPLPDTILAASETEVFPVDNVNWRAPVSIRKTTEGASTALLWRTADGRWRRASDDGMLDLTGLGAGTHTLELCAEEEGFWRDQSPVSVVVKFEPNYDKIVSFYLSNLASNDPAKQERARRRLLELGETGLPILQEKLRGAEEAQRYIHTLRNIIRELQGGGPSYPPPGWGP